VNHPKRTANTDANFVHAKAYRRHRLPVRRFLAHLDEPELNTGLVSRLRGKARTRLRLSPSHTTCFTPLSQFLYKREPLRYCSLTFNAIAPPPLTRPVGGKSGSDPDFSWEGLTPIFR